ncbi:hypothetical protein PA905_33530 [Planktothrix agardhii CCAP 1459/11A]|jgi:Domain of unknown function (DUF4276)|uniref:DUF4276 domain-containing protein n=1 Tax=Planktothrix agardhii CCAP 1459/11A TaxID=282420 RepID=A0A4P5ZJ06_PLAAG|nr:MULTISPECIES: DUF4276 family protein [Planktothrix]GDZ95114.1 hypothetical protein PA905_33530 [Planktothrix agardhii CCAP 1459/11A]CAD5971434.1 hypothetical protein NO108_04175 [Planktothrix rubescens]CAD5979099.1 hypothetical protein NO758_04405 [Planktothrix agardhii]
MSYDLIFLLEEPSIKNVLEEILPKIIPEQISFICIAHQGKQDLAKSIAIKIRAFKTSPHTQFIIVHDQDSHDCQKLKAELLQICQTAGQNNPMIRIICHELESWFLGDLEAVETAYNLKPNTLSKHQNNRKYRNPDQLNSAKQELKNLVREYYPATHSKKIAPYLSLTDNKSKSFKVFIQGIQNIIINLNY